MSEVVLTADIHFGVPGRLRDTVWACRVVRDYCTSRGIEVVINLGDLCHDRRSLDLEVLCALHDFLASTREAGQRWITYPGNHDMYLKHSWDINSARPLSGVVEVIDDVKLLVLDDRRHWVLPFVHFERSYMRVLAAIEERYEPGDTLLTHVGVRGSTLNTCFLLKDWSFVHFEESKFERVYTGHFHSAQSLPGKDRPDQVVYPGSLLPFKFDEGGVPHGFLVYNTATGDHRFVDIWEAGRGLIPGETPPPQFLTVLDEQLGDLVEADVRDNLVRVHLGRDYSRDERAELRSRLLDLGARGVHWMTAAADPGGPGAVLPGSAAQAIPPEGLFRHWYRQDRPAGIPERLAYRLEAEVRAEGDERYAYDESEI